MLTESVDLKEQRSGGMYLVSLSLYDRHAGKESAHTDLATIAHQSFL